MTIPRIIHYCWFGGGELPPLVQRCITSWHKNLPDYEFVRWDETNSDLKACKYVEEAYAARQYAFVSDYVRLSALVAYGGVYLDTDVEVVRSLDPFLGDGITLGFEEFNYVATSTLVAPKNSAFLNAFLQTYHERSFRRPDGSLDQSTNVAMLTRQLAELGLRLDGSEQTVVRGEEQIRIVEQDVFSPMDYANGILKITDRTATVHHFGQSWAVGAGVWKNRLRHLLIHVVGGRNLKLARATLKRFFR